MLSDSTNVLHLVLLFFTLFTGMLVYFKIAEHYKIIDKPSQRSSHLTPTIRGGGIVFVLALYYWFILYRLSLPWFVIGSTIIAAVSFADDIRPQHPALRLSAHMAAFSLIMWQTGMFSNPILLVLLMYLVGVGALNAFNFMDGINGMTGVYALVNLVTFLYVNDHIVHFSHSGLIVFMIVAVIVFLYFNFRGYARCFAGDVGSMTLALVQIFLLLQLIGTTHNFTWVLFFLVYGIDTVITIVYRLWRRENIFAAHRTHFYQYLANELGMSHLLVSLIYGVVQSLFNVLIIVKLSRAPGWATVLVVLIAGLGYLVVRMAVTRSLARRE